MIEPSLHSLIEHDLCIVEIFSYFDSIYDYKALILTNSSIMKLVVNDKKLIRLRYDSKEKD